MIIDSNLTGLGLEQTTFVGRTEELARLTSLLGEGARLLTIVGPPGTGKTRIARELAGRIAAGSSRPEGGVWFVDLTEARSPDGVCAQVAGALGLRISLLAVESDAGDEAVEQIGHALATLGPTLIVLDNFEQVVTRGARLVSMWAAASDASFVVTSREALRIDGEHVFDLPTLAPPAGDDERAVRDSDAVQLLVSRARGFTVDGGNAVAVAALVRQLDGLPLALELAAARLHVMGPAELSERMHQRLDVLGPAGRGVSARQATLRGALDWSWELLDGDERAAFAATSVFHGGFSLAAAEQVLEGRALDLLTSLCDKSLVRADTIGGRSRYELLEAVRDYAGERLEESGRAEAARERHAAWLVADAPGVASRVHGPSADDAVRWLSAELDNALAAVGYLAALAGVEALERRVALLLAVEPVLSVRGPHALHLSLLDEVAAASELAALDPTRRAGVGLARGRALAARGRMPDAVAALSSAAEAAEEAADPILSAEILCERGQAEQAQGRLSEARRMYASALDLLDRDRSPRLYALALRGVGLSHHGQGALDDAWTAYEQALQLMRAAGDRAGVAGLHAQIGTLRLSQGRLEEAREAYDRALADDGPLPDPVAAGLVEGNLGILEQECGRLAEARVHYERGLSHVRMGGVRLLEAHMLGYLGGLHHELGELADAGGRYEEAIAVLTVIGDDRLAGVFRAASGAVHAARDRPRAALEQLDRAETLLSGIGDPGPLLALSLHRGHLELAESRVALSQGRPADAATRRENAEARAAAARTDSALSDSDDARFALRLLGLALGEATLIVRGAADEVQPPGGEVIRLGKREALRNIVAALVARRREAPGDALGLDDLLAAGWPGERVKAEAGINRVKVALSTLRKLGLRKVLLRHDDGYLLDPDVPLIEEKG